MPQDSHPDFEPLISLLKQRVTTIADHELRDSDPDRHLEALKSVSEAIQSEYMRVKAHIPVRLDHFLSQCSYDKALRFIENLPAPPAAQG